MVCEVIQIVQVMNKAIDMHDRVLRGLLGKHCGFEVTTEGDAFQFVFHHANDAVGRDPPPLPPSLSYSVPHHYVSTLTKFLENKAASP